MKKITFYLLILATIWASCTPKSVQNEPLDAVLKKIFPKSNEFQFDTLPMTGHVWVQFFDGDQYAQALFLADSLNKNTLKLSEIRQDWTVERLPAPVREELKKQVGEDLGGEMLNKLEKISRYTGGGASAPVFAVETETSTDFWTIELDEFGKIRDQAKIPISQLEAQQKEEEGVDPNQTDDDESKENE